MQYQTELSGIGFSTSPHTHPNTNPTLELAMTCPTAVSANAIPATGTGGVRDSLRTLILRGRLSPAAAFVLLSSLTVSFLAGSAAPTPLYPFYQAQWGFSPVMVTVVFGIYAVAVLSALLVAGRLSDYIGRRPVLLIATVTQSATMLLFATADGLSSLLLARVIQGLSTGAAVAAVGAGLLDLDKVRGTTANAIAPALGTASGGILAGLMVQFLPQPSHLVYLLLGVVFIAQAIGMVFMAETATPRAGALASLKPQFKLPPAVRGPLLLAVPALVAPWALAGFYGSLAPTLVRGLIGSNAPLLGGLALFVLAGGGAVSILLLRHRQPRIMMAIGAAALLVGVAIVMAALSYHATLPFFIGTTLAGMGFGAAFQGAIRNVVPFAAPQERAGVLSVIFVVSYLAMGVPAVAAGYLVARTGNIFATAYEFGSVVMLLAVLALLGVVARRAK